jgi:hypothetical protein
MVTPSQKSDVSRKRGGVTVELVAACVVIGVPVLLALTELARLDLAARRLQFEAQEACIQAAVAGNEDRSFRLISVVSRTQVSARPEWRRLQDGAGCSVTLKRQYWIGTGSGHGENW